MTRAKQRNSIKPIELFAVIVVVVILIAILVPVLGPINSHRPDDFQIMKVEITHLDYVIENFKTEFGFYPPDFSTINSADEFNVYLLKIAPNHREDVANWWGEVGCKLDPSNALVFWLSSLRDDPVYPLSYDHDNNPATARLFAPIYSHSEAVQDAVGDRKVFFEFKPERIHVTGNVASYGQANGNTELPYIYFNSDYIDRSGNEKTYTEPVTGDVVRPYLKIAGVVGEYQNQHKFQIIAPGNDNRYGTYGATGTPNWKINPHVQTHRDNLTNFSNGYRLDSE